MICVVDFHDLCPRQSHVLCRKVYVMESELKMTLDSEQNQSLSKAEQHNFTSSQSINKNNRHREKKTNVLWHGGLKSSNFCNFWQTAANFRQRRLMVLRISTLAINFNSSKFRGQLPSYHDVIKWPFSFPPHPMFALPREGRPSEIRKKIAKITSPTFFIVTSRYITRL